MWFWILFPLLLNKDDVKPLPIEINFSYRFSRPNVPHIQPLKLRSRKKIIKKKLWNKKRAGKREHSKSCGKWSEAKQWKPLEWCLAFTFLRWVPHPLEIIDGKGRLARRLPEPWCRRTGGLRPLSCICKCATAAFPPQGRKTAVIRLQNSFIWVFHWGTTSAERATFVKFRAWTATAELYRSEFYNMQDKEHEKQRLLQRGRRL